MTSFKKISYRLFTRTALGASLALLGTGALSAQNDIPIVPASELTNDEIRSFKAISDFTTPPAYTERSTKTRSESADTFRPIVGSTEILPVSSNEPLKNDQNVQKRSPATAIPTVVAPVAGPKVAPGLFRKPVSESDSDFRENKSNNPSHVKPATNLQLPLATIPSELTSEDLPPIVGPEDAPLHMRQQQALSPPATAPRVANRANTPTTDAAPLPLAFEGKMQPSELHRSRNVNPQQLPPIQSLESNRVVAQQNDVPSKPSLPELSQESVTRPDAKATNTETVTNFQSATNTQATTNEQPAIRAQATTNSQSGAGTSTQSGTSGGNLVETGDALDVIEIEGVDVEQWPGDSAVPAAPVMQSDSVAPGYEMPPANYSRPQKYYNPAFANFKYLRGYDEECNVGCDVGEGGYPSARGRQADCLDYGYGCHNASPNYMILEGLYFDRGDERFSLSNSFFLDPYDYEYGLRFTFGSRNDELSGREISYVGPFRWEENRTQTSAGGGLNSTFTAGTGVTAANLSAFNNATSHQQSIDSNLNSLEYNGVWCGWDIMTFTLGMRYVRLEDRYRFASVRGAQRGFYNVDTQNNLIGPQIGLESYYDVGKRLSFSVRGKAGAMANIYRGETLFNNNGFIIANSDSDNVDFSGLFEFGATAHYQLGPSFRFRAGYEGWVLTEVATVNSNLSNTISNTTGQAISNNDDVLVHGLSAGLELFW